METEQFYFQLILIYWLRIGEKEWRAQTIFLKITLVLSVGPMGRDVYKFLSSNIVMAFGCVNVARLNYSTQLLI